MNLCQEQFSSYSEFTDQVLKNKGRRILAISAIGGGLLLGASNQALQAQIHFEDPITYPDGIELGTNEVFNRSEFHDLDNDGDRDLVATAYDNSSNYLEDIIFYENIGTEGDFEFAAPMYIDMQSPELSPSLFTFGDLDNDGDLDALQNVAVYDTSGVYYYDRVFVYYENESQTGFSFKDSVIDPYGLDQYNSYSFIAFSNLIDVDGDGDLDILQVDLEYGDYHFIPQLRFIENTGTADNPVFASPVSIQNAFKDIVGLVLPTYGDMDNDGDIDILGVRYDYDNYTANYFFSENIGENGGLEFDTINHTPFNLDSIGSLENFGEDPHLVDYDSDGDLDIFATAYLDPKVKLYLNTQTSSVKQIQLSDFGIEVYPNPVRDKVNLKIPNPIEGNVKITTNDGKLLIEQNLQHPQTGINVSQLQAGVYFIHIQTKHFEGATPIVIEK